MIVKAFLPPLTYLLTYHYSTAFGNLWL